MPEDRSSDAPAPARPSVPERPPVERDLRASLADSWHAWRGDPRVGAAALALVAVAAGAFWFRSASGAPRVAAAPTVATTVPLATTTVPPDTAIVVHVAGAVERPGIVELRGGARVVDAIVAAGGALAEAELDRLNLAAPVADGQRVAVPRVGEPTPPVDASTGGASDGAVAQPVNLNTATVAELETLPGIGPTLAAAIVAERERLGGFRAVDDLQRVRGIGEQRYARLRDLVTL